MKSFKVSLKELYNLEGGELECILSEPPFDAETDWKRPAVVVVPGGAYWMNSRREGEPVAHAFLARGFQTFILTYSCAPDGARYPDQLTQLAAAMDYVRKNAEQFNVNPKEVFAVGFSAGGHLTADLAVEYASVKEISGLELDCRPTAVGLCYPVISIKGGHVGSYANLLSGYTEEAKTELLKKLNLDEAVDEMTAPSFIWTTAEDGCVPSINSLMFAAALAKHNVLYELHVYPQGAHGQSVCNHEVNGGDRYLDKNSAWVDNCAEFFRLFTEEKY